MGELILCKTAATVPYFLKSVAKNVYSLEELAWCVKEYAEMAAGDIYTANFARWVKEELKQEETGETLAVLLDEDAGLPAFTDAVLAQTPYLDEEEKKAVQSELVAYEQVSLFEREIRKADRLLANGKLKSSIRAYQVLTPHLPKDAREEKLSARIWHNMGTAYARLFLFAQAEACYQKAFAKDPDPRIEKEARLCAACRNDAVYEQENDAPEVQKLLEELQDKKRAGKREDYQKLLFSVIERWKQEYKKAAEDEEDG